jgi:hypothetical protein
VHSYVASLLDGVRLELRELKGRSTLLGVCTTCPLLRSDSETAVVEIKDIKHKLDHSSRYTILFPPCEACVSLNGRDGNGSGSGRVEQLPARQQRGCG